MEDTDRLKALKRLREPFPDNQISKLPKPTKQQTEEVRANYRAGIRCSLCGAWHHKDVVHLDYVGHAALTDRLLEVDPLWTWEPVSFDERGLPALDKNGGLWIKLTICGVTRIGYGNAEPKNTGIAGDHIKELIGDALRNAAMRFGCALDLWHKGDLHAHVTDDETQETPKPEPEAKTKPLKVTNGMTPEALDTALIAMEDAKTFDDLKKHYAAAYKAGTSEQKAVVQTAYEGIKTKKGWA